MENEPSQIQNSRGNNSAGGRRSIGRKAAKATEGSNLQERKSASFPPGSRKEDVLDRLKAAMDDAREAGQRERPQVSLIEEENRRKEEDAVKAAEEAREAAQREQLALIEEENRRKEEAMALERAEKESRQREASLREEENRRREEARAKEARARAAKEAREAKKREQTLKREAKRREKERIARERAEREAREEAERGRQREIAAQREREAAAVEQYVVSETSLVTCSAGFNIQHVIPGFELCRIVIKNLPRNARQEEIADIFIQQGVQRSEFMVFQVKVIGNKQEAVVLANAEHGEAISLGLDGIEFRDQVLRDRKSVV